MNVRRAIRYSVQVSLDPSEDNRRQGDNRMQGAYGSCQMPLPESDDYHRGMVAL